jgi:hypothetical protein
MMYEFTVPKGKKLNPDDVPTAVSVGGREYEVVEGCIEAPSRFQNELKAHGFEMRRRPSITVREMPVSKPSPTGTSPEEDSSGQAIERAEDDDKDIKSEPPAQRIGRVLPKKEANE